MLSRGPSLSVVTSDLAAYIFPCFLCSGRQSHDAHYGPAGRLGGWTDRGSKNKEKTPEPRSSLSAHASLTIGRSNSIWKEKTHDRPIIMRSGRRGPTEREFYGPLEEALRFAGIYIKKKRREIWRSEQPTLMSGPMSGLFGGRVLAKRMGRSQISFVSAEQNILSSFLLICNAPPQTGPSRSGIEDFIGSQNERHFSSNLIY